MTNDLDLSSGIYTDGEDAVRWREIWRSLGGSARDVLYQLVVKGPTYDGDVISKAGRDELLDKKLAAKVVLSKCEWGFQAATYLGAHVCKAGHALKGAQ